LELLGSPDEGANGSKTRPKIKVPDLVYIVEFWYYGTMTRVEQQHKVLKAKVALMLYSKYSRVPKEWEVDKVYHLTRVLYKAVLGTHFAPEDWTTSVNLMIEK
jgi:hypothetical protein